MNNNEPRSALLLLVEDDQSMLDGMADLFQMPSLLQTIGIHYNMEVMTANNGRQALDLMQKRQPDLIVSDIMMPVMDGYQFLNEVQKNPDWLHIPFIFLTAKGDKKEILEGTLRGANLYITKPFASTELLELIKGQLDRSFQRQLTYQQNVGNLKKGILQILNHEFRTPLTYVTAYYEMLSESLNRAPEGQDFREYLRGIQAGCVRLTRLIEDFILVIELRTGEYKTRFNRQAKLVTTINNLIEATVQNYIEEAAKRRTEF
ncbi:MAG: response regulator, partial [Anaerolineae bacterium]